MALTLATFNVKNLLQPGTELAARTWPAKIAWIAATLAACDADVVGLQEIGSAGLLMQVLDRPELRGRYATPLMGTTDARGIGCALVARVPLLATKVHTAAALAFPVFREGDPPPYGARLPLRRGIVQARVRADGIGDVDVFVAHFKSARPVRARDLAGIEIAPRGPYERSEGGVRSVVWRTAEALHVRRLVDAALGAPPSPDVHAAVVGDFNDVLESAAVRALRGEGEGALLDCTAAAPPERRFTTLHGGQRVQIDHVLATAGLHARVQAATFHNEALREHEPPPRGGGAPGEAYEEAPTADSDHAPVVVRFG
jgi:endonuclease/exonuclease/phosphatase family metal-dependent hydrolase